MATPTLKSIVVEELAREYKPPLTDEATKLIDEGCEELDQLITRADLFPTRQTWDNLDGRLAQFLVALTAALLPHKADRIAVRRAVWRITRRVFVELLGVVPRLRGVVFIGPPEFNLPLIDRNPDQLAAVLAWLFPQPRTVSPAF